MDITTKTGQTFGGISAALFWNRFPIPGEGRRKILSAFLLSAFLLSGCANTDNDLTGEASGSPTADDELLRVAVGVSTPTTPVTRAGLNNDNITTQDLNLWVTPKNAPTAEYTHKAINLHYTDNQWGTYNNVNPVILYNKMRSQMEIVACSYKCAYGTSLPTTQVVSVLADQTEGANINSSDFLYFKGTVDPTLTSDKVENGAITAYALASGKKIRLPMKHVNCKLTIELSLGTEFSGEGGLGRQSTNPVSVPTLSGSYITKYINLTTGNFNNGSYNQESITPYLLSYTPTTSSTGKAKAVYELIILPQSLKPLFLFTLGEKNYTWTSSNEISFLGGFNYTIRLTAGKETITSLELTSAPWEDGGDANIGTE